MLDVDSEKRTVTAYARSGVKTYAVGDTFVHPAAPWLSFSVATLFSEIDR